MRTAATLRVVVAGLWLAAASAPLAAQQQSDLIAPETATSGAASAPFAARRQIVVSAHPAATAAGVETLRRGGSAADAAVVVQTVLGLVEPQSSGLGGGAFLLWYDAASRSLTSFDAREAAPAAATPDLFRLPDGTPLGFFDAVVGGRSVGTPGVPRLLETMHRRYGKRPWTSLFDPAIRLAQDGFPVSPRLAESIALDAARLASQPSTRAYFLDPAGNPLQSGTVVRNSAYAETLRALATGGADAFYRGPVAGAIVDAVRSHAGNPGLLTEDDLAVYRVKERPPVCLSYRGHDVCGMGPPSSGGTAVGQILGLLEPFDLAGLGPDDPVAWRLIGDATRLAFADRERYLADSDFVSIPHGLLDRSYLASRSALLRRDTALPPSEVVAGEPPWAKAELRQDGITAEIPSTSHFVIVDAEGNIASMTTSIENAFGARLMVGGFLLNNQLTDFAFAPVSGGENVANRVEPGKRPRSSMAPTIVLRDGRPALALGSPGGSNIIPYVARTLVAMIDWHMDVQSAVAMPHMLNRFGTYELESGTTAERFAADLQALGYEVETKGLNSGLNAVAWTKGGMEAGTDPRREGVAAGD